MTSWIEQHEQGLSMLAAYLLGVFAGVGITIGVLLLTGGGEV